MNKKNVFVKKNKYWQFTNTHGVKNIITYLIKSNFHNNQILKEGYCYAKKNWKD